MSTFLRTFSITKPIAPAHLVRTATNTGVGDFKLIDSNASFLAIAQSGMVVVNVTDGKQARVLRVLSDTELLLNKHIFSAVGKTYELLLPAQAAIAPGTGQELILFYIWSRNPISAGDAYKIMVLKEGLTGYKTTPMAETGANSDFVEIANRRLPTDTEFYIIENSCKETADCVIEGLDKTLSKLQTETSTESE